MREVSEIPYQTSTMDSGIIEVLYEGKSLQDAVKAAALDYGGACVVRHFRDDGTMRDVAEYRNGQTTRGFVYE